MKKTVTVASALVLGASLGLGCAVHAGATVDAVPPPPPDVSAQAGVSGQASVSAQADGQADMAPAPDQTDDPEELVATSEPPELVYEEQTDSPGAGMVWVGGYWQWTGNDWVWYYGGWYPAPEGRVYVEPYYEHVDDHVVYVTGYWGVAGAEPRYYGGDRIVFTAAVRPEGYVRGRYAFVARSTGLPPGHRGHYGPRPAGVRARPLPTATAPRRALAHGGGRVEAGGHAGTESAGGRAEAKGEVKTEARPEAKPEARPESRPAPAPKPAPKKRPRR